MNYLNHNDDSLSYIYITDIRVNEEVAELLDKRGGVFLLDHHPTALELNKYSWCKVIVEYLNGVKTSGTKMFYHWLGMNGYDKNTNAMYCIFQKYDKSGITPIYNSDGSVKLYEE